MREVGDINKHKLIEKKRIQQRYIQLTRTLMGDVLKVLTWEDITALVEVMLNITIDRRIEQYMLLVYTKNAVEVDILEKRYANTLLPKLEQLTLQEEIALIDYIETFKRQIYRNECVIKSFEAFNEFYFLGKAN